MIIMSLLTIVLLAYSIYSMNTSDYKEDVGYTRQRSRLLLFTSISLIVILIIAVVLVICSRMSVMPLDYMIEGNFIEIPMNGITY